MGDRYPYFFEQAAKEAFNILKAGVQLGLGAGFNSGFIAGRGRYNYKDLIPRGFEEKRTRIESIAKAHGIDIITAALHFVLAADEFVSIIPGCSRPEQVVSNVRALNTAVPVGFWSELKSKGLIYDAAQVPQ